MSEGLLGLIWDVQRAARSGPSGVERRQRARLHGMVAHARAHSPYYRQLYRDLPSSVEDFSLLPVTNKSALMAHFDDWPTDREATRDKLRSFVAEPKRVGERFLGRYTAVTTSGTTGTPGMFLMDERNLAVTKAISLRMLGSWLQARDVLRILLRGGRMSMVMATGGHFASAVAATRLTESGRSGRRIQVLSVHMPLAEVVAELNRFQPAVIAPYASMASLLADEQAAGRLQIHPTLLALAAEGLPQPEYARIAEVFGAKVGNSYACTECSFLSQSCSHGWLHVNADWAVLEPVDAEHRPVLAGVTSHTVLLSNLANRVQPILRYDLGDSVLQRPDPCPCGSPLPAIRVQGRTADVLTFSKPSGERVSIPPLSFATLEDLVPALERFQVVQHSPASLAVRSKGVAGVAPDQVAARVRDEIMRLLAGYGLDHVAVERDDSAPEQTSGGKFRPVIPLKSS